MVSIPVLLEKIKTLESDQRKYCFYLHRAMMLEPIGNLQRSRYSVIDFAPKIVCLSFDELERRFLFSYIFMNHNSDLSGRRAVLRRYYARELYFHRRQF
jgi:hypothetical protein